MSFRGAHRWFCVGPYADAAAPPPSLNQVLKHLEQGGLIRIHYGRITIADR